MGRAALRATLWAALIGLAIGLVLTPDVGDEPRRHLRAIVDHLICMIEPQAGS
jgi:hypothetical protein